MKLRGIWLAVICGALLPAMAAFSALQAGAPQDQQTVDPHEGLYADPHHHGSIDPHQGMYGAFHRDASDPAWDNDAFFMAMYREPQFSNRGAGYLIGYRAGYEDGRRDIEDGEQSHLGYRFRYPDHYRLEFGDRDDYIREYQEGYTNGYKRGYASQA